MATHPPVNGDELHTGKPAYRVDSQCRSVRLSDLRGRDCARRDRPVRIWYRPNLSPPVEQLAPTVTLTGGIA